MSTPSDKVPNPLEYLNEVVRKIHQHNKIGDYGVLDVTFVKNKEKCPKGYYKFCDLDTMKCISTNEGAKWGEDIYMCIKKGKSMVGLVNVTLIFGTGPCPGDYEKDPQNLNEGSVRDIFGGIDDDPIYLCKKYASGEPFIKDIIIVRGQNVRGPPGYERVTDFDLNPASLGGAYLSLWILRGNHSDTIINYPQNIYLQKWQNWLDLNKKERDIIIPIISKEFADMNVFPIYILQWSNDNPGKNDYFMSQYCKKNKNDPECKCINSPINKYEHNPLCLDRSCIAFGYAPTSMLTAKQGGCRFVDCSMYIDLKKTPEGQTVIFNDPEINQRCGVGTIIEPPRDDFWPNFKWVLIVLAICVTILLAIYIVIKYFYK